MEVNITLRKDEDPIQDISTINYEDNNYLNIFLAYDYGMNTLMGKHTYIYYKLEDESIYSDDFIVQSHGMKIRRKIDHNVYGVVNISFAIKDKTTYINIPQSIILSIENTTPSQNNENLQGYSQYELSEDFIVQNNKIYINNNDKYEYNDIFINSIEKIISDTPLSNSNTVYFEKVSDNIYIKYSIKTDRIDDISSDLHEFAINYYKNNAYNILEKEKTKLLLDYLCGYFFGIKNINVYINKDKIKKWYKEEEEKISTYDDLSNDLIIDKY